MARRRLRWLRLGRGAGAGLLAGTVAWASWGQAPGLPADTAAVSALIRQGEAQETQQPAAARASYARALAAAERLHFDQGYFRGMRLLTFALNNVGRHEEARRLALRALGRARQDTSQYHLGLCYFALGVTAWRQGDYPEAVRQYHQAEYYMERLHRTYNLNVIHGNLAVIYQEQGLFDQALRELELVLRAQQREHADSRALAITLYNLAATHWLRHDGPQAKKYFGLMGQHLDARQDPDLRLALDSSLGEVLAAEAEASPPGPVRRARYDSAFWHHRRALRLSRQLGNPVDELHELTALAATYNGQHAYAQAEPLLAQALAMVRRHGNAPVERQAIYGELVRLYRGQGRYAAALRWHDRYQAVADSLRNQTTKDLLDSYQLRARQADAQLTLQAKQAQIDRLQGERQRQRLWLSLATVAGLGAAALLLLGYAYFRQRQRAQATALLALQREQDLRAVQAEAQGQQKERVRIAKEMHDDMGASLTVIGLLSEVMKTRPELAAAPEVGKISMLSADLMATLNQVIWSLNPRNDSLNGLIAYVRAYAREFLDHTALHLRLEAEEAATDRPIAGDDRRHVFLAVKEALHNVVKHAHGATGVTLRIRGGAQELFIEISDDGTGFAAAAPAPRPGQHHGLPNMRTRMRDAGGRCEVRSSPQGTCIQLTYRYRPAPEIRHL